MFDFTRLVDRIALHEGFRPKVYKDSVGVLTIGYGRNLEHNGITEDEAEYLLRNDVQTAINGARGLFDNFDALDDVRQEVLVEMAFNLGAVRLSQFKKMIAAVERFDFAAAADEMKDSLWHNQVKMRATELEGAMLTGKF